MQKIKLAIKKSIPISFRNLKYGLAAGICLLAIMIFLGGSVSAQNVSGGAGGSIWSYVQIGWSSFISSITGDDSNQENRQRPVNPYFADESEKNGSSNLQELPSTSLASPCPLTGATLNVPGTYSTIQAAINNANPLGGDKIIVAAGIYTEQIVVNKCLSITGAGEGVTVIQAPATLTNSNVPLVNARSIVEIRSNAYVTISGLTVTGLGQISTSGNEVYGVFVVENGTLEMTDATVSEIRDANPSLRGLQNGNAIRAGSVASNQIGSLDLTRVTVEKYQKTGIIVSRNGSTATIDDSDVVGEGAQTYIAQNGVQVSGAATATITASRINGNLCDNPACSFSTYYSYGVIAFESGAINVSGTVFNNNDGGIYAWTPGATSTVSGNVFTNSRYAGIDIDQGTTNISNNFIVGSGFGPVVGIGAYSYNGNTANTIGNLQQNSITDALQANVELTDFSTSDVAFPTVTANFNRLSGNARGVNNATTSSTVSAENNFWGCNGGPQAVSGNGCSTISNLVDADPWLILDDTISSQGSVNAGGTATITTSLRKNSDGVTQTTYLPNPIAGIYPNGIPVNFSSNSFGSVSPAVTPLINGSASTTFTGGTVDGGDQIAVVTAQVDNATDSVNVTVLDTVAPTVISANVASQTSTTVTYTVTFSEAVNGVDAGDFAVTTVSGNAAASVTNVTGTGNTRTVTVTVSSGMGVIRLDVLDDDSIVDTASALNPLNGAANDPTFNGQTAMVDVQMPTVTIIQAAGQPDPTSASTINFTVVFNEPVTGFGDAGSDVDLSASTAGGTLTATVTEIAPNDDRTYNVAVTGMSSSGTVVASIPANAAVDSGNNGNTASTSTDNSVTYLQAVVTNINTGLTYPTIQAANDAPQTLNGHTIRASAGVYPERVVVTKSLTIQGAQYGNDARVGRANVNAESTVGIGQPTPSDPAAGAFIVQSAVAVTIDGFRIAGVVRPDGDATSILLVGSVGGNQIINNIFDGNQGAVFSSVPGNTFRRNRVNTTTGTVGTDAYFGGTDNTTITENSFTGGYPNGAINTTRGPGSSTNVQITDNTFQATGNFIVLFATTGAQITGNTSGGTSSTTIFAGGGNTNTNVADNTLNLLGGNGILFYDAGFGYGNNSGITIQNNTVTRDVTAQTGNPSAFDLRGVAGTNTVSFNTVTFSGVLPATLSSHAIRIRGSASGNFNIAGNSLNGGNIASTGVVKPSGLYLTSVQAADGTPATNVGTLPTSSVINAPCNTFNGFGDGVTVFRNDTNVAGGLPTGIDVNINGNNFVGNSQFGINNGGTSETIDGTNNYWNSASGPGGAGPGSGDAVSANVTFSPFLTASSTCAPVNTVPAAQTINQDTTLTFSAANSNQISVADADVLNNPVTVMLSVDNGTLTLSQTTGLTFTTGDGTADATMTFLGTLADINAALNGLIFTPNPGFVGTSTLSITSSSTGSPGVGGGTQTATDSVTINVLDAIAPTVLSINRGTPPGPNTNASTVIFNVTFSEPVAGVDASDFALAGTINFSGATITVSTPDSGTTRTVTVTGYTGDGTLGLNLVDDDSITDAQSNPLGGSGTGNGNLIGQVYTIDQTRPTVQITQAAGQFDPTTASPINFTVTFSESVAPTFINTDVDTTASGATIGGVIVTNPSNDGMTFNVEVTPTSPGTVVINIAQNVATDAFGNGNFAFTPDANSDNSVTYFTVSAAKVVDDDGQAALSGTTPDCGATTAAPNLIQTAINLASSGDTIYVCPGTYIEQLNVNKQLTLLGPQAGVNPNDVGNRTDPNAEATIIPSISDPDFFTGPILVSLRAQGITFNGFTLDGNNPALTSGVIFNGVDVDAAEGIDMPDNNFAGLNNPQETITYNIIKNIGDLGIALGGNGSANNVNSTIRYNKIDNIPGVNYGGGVYVGNNAYTNVTDNVITRVSLGVVIENFSQTGAASSTIGNNQITANRMGIRHNLHYNYSTNGFTISGNTITSYLEAADPTATRFSGIRIESINGAVPATFSGNTIDANRDVLLGNSPLAEKPKVTGSVFYNKQENRRAVVPKTAVSDSGVPLAYTRIDGIFLTNTFSTSNFITITGNEITNALRGISHNIPGIPTVTCNSIFNNDVGIYVGHDIQFQNQGDPPSESYATGGINIGDLSGNGNNIVGNTTFGVQVDQSSGLPPIPAGSTTVAPANAPGNYWGAANGPGPVGTGNGDKITALVNVPNFATSPVACAPVQPPTATINKASGQNDPTNTLPISFTVVFSEAVTGFDASDISFAGSTVGGTLTATAPVSTDGGITYNFSVSGATSDGDVVVNVPVGAAQSVATNAPTSAATPIDNTVAYDTTAPTVTANPTTGQNSPTNNPSISFTIDFNEMMTGFTQSDLTGSLTNATITSFTDNGDTTYTVVVTANSCMAQTGCAVTLFVPANSATDAAGNGNIISNTASVTYDGMAPAVTVEGVADPDTTSPVEFTATFNEPVTGFTASDVVVIGTAFTGTPIVTVTEIAPNNGTTYRITVTGMNQSGTVQATVAAGLAFDAAGNGNTASTAGTPNGDVIQFNLVSTPVTVNPTNTDTPGITDWSGYNDVTNTLTPPSYVAGPATPPVGVGSARLNTTATGKYLFFTTYFNSVAALPLSQITNLRYSSYAVDPSNAANLPSLQLGIDFDSTDTNTGFQGRLVFEPANNQTSPNQPTAQNQWQTWDATNGRFWFTQAPGNGSCGQATPCSMATILATYPRINIPNTPFGFIGFRSTGGGTVAVENYVDNFIIGINSADTTFDFEPTPPTVSISDASVTEPNAGTTTVNFTVSISTPSQLDTTVTVATADGTATTANNDYAALSQNVTIPAGQTSAAVAVTINGDTNVEPNENFTVNLSNAVNASILDGQGVGTINNDDVVVGFCNAIYNGAEGTPTATITVCRNGVTPNTVTVNYATGNGTATAGQDYTAASGILTFAPNDTTQSFTVPITDDIISEGPAPETVNLTLSVLTGGAVFGTQTAVLNITDNDGGGFVTISGNIKQYNAPNPNTNLPNVTVTLVGGPGGTTTTDANGNYSFTNLPVGISYQVTPSGLGKIYDPIYRNYSSLNININNADFLAYNNLNDVPRKVRVGYSTVLPTQPVTVPVKLDALGNENGVSFSLSYNTARLNSPVVTLGPDAAGAALIANTSTPGTVIVTLANAPNTTFTAGAKHLVNIQFQTVATTDFNTPLTFNASPRNVNDANANPLQAQFVSGFVVYQQGIEGDVNDDINNHPDNGDGDVDSGDFIEIGQYAAGLSTPDFASSNEYQRADVEPTVTKGDADVDLGDFIQAGRYAAGLDPLQSVGGPAYPVPPPPFAELMSSLENRESSIPRVVRVVNTNASRGQQVTVSIQIDAESGDKGASFTLDYDATKLSNPQVTLGSGASGAFLIPNTTTPGKVGVVLGFITGGFQGGISQLVTIQFNVASNAAFGLTPLTFNDTPVQRQIRDSSNVLVAANFADGNINIAPPSSASVSVGGKVVDAGGNHIVGANITLTDANGQSISVRTNSFGNYVFNGVRVGETYTVSIGSKKYTFTPDSRTITISDNVTDVDFTADN